MTVWCRLWHDMPTDPKFRTIAKASGQPLVAVIAVFTFMLVDASANATERGRTHANDENVASALDLEIDAVAAIREAMQGRILEGERFKKWEIRQPRREDNSAERSKAWREEKKSANADERTRTQPNARERPDTDTDTEIDKEYTGGRAATRPGEPSRFDEFWSVYPRRQGANPKEPARKKFEAACRAGEDPDKIIAAARRYAADMASQQQAGTPYVAQALTWLNQRRWDDAPITVLPFGQAPPIRSPANTRC